MATPRAGRRCRPRRRSGRGWLGRGRVLPPLRLLLLRGTKGMRNTRKCVLDPRREYRRLLLLLRTGILFNNSFCLSCVLFISCESIKMRRGRRSTSFRVVPFDFDS